MIGRDQRRGPVLSEDPCLTRVSARPSVNSWDSSSADVSSRSVRRHSIATGIKARDELGLKDALWSYWIAKEAPLGLDLPIYSAAVESLQAAWFRVGFR